MKIENMNMEMGLGLGLGLGFLERERDVRKGEGERRRHNFLFFSFPFFSSFSFYLNCPNLGFWIFGYVMGGAWTGHRASEAALRVDAELSKSRGSTQ